MTSPALVTSAIVIAPPARAVADPTHEHGPIFRVAHSASSAQATAADIPENLRGRYWRLLTIGAHVNWAWLLDEDWDGDEDTAPTLVYGQLTATGTGHASAAGTLLDGMERHVMCPPNARGLVFISSAGPVSGTWFEAELSGAKIAVSR